MAVDYTKFKTDGTRPEGDQAAFDKKWWLANKQDRPQVIAQLITQLAQYDSKRNTQYQIAVRLYGNTNLMGLNGLSYSKIASTQNSLKDRLTYNVVQSAVDTITAKIAKNKPKPLFLTSGGDYKMQRKAKKLDKFVEGVFYENHAYKMGTQAFRDSAVFGDGVTHVFNKDGKVCHERIISSELYVDWVEAFYGHPRQLHRVKNIDRDVALANWPTKRSVIMEANSASADLTGAYQNVADQICVAESWHLPSGPEAKDGLHVISLANGELFSEPWTKPYFPFAFLHWSKRLYGFWGQGLAEQIQNIQLEINKILWVIQRSIHLAGSFKVLIENGSKIVKEYLNNDIGAIITYNGTPPQFITPPAVPVEFYQQLTNLKQAAFEQAGVSMLSAASQKPAGLNSGKALREYNDIESDRFMTIGQQYENYFLELARLSIDVAKEIAEEEGDYVVKHADKKYFDEIKWSEIELDEDDYVMKMFPVSSLPSEPAGRLQTIQEYIQAGFLTPRAGRRLLDFPDLEQIESLQNSEEDYIHEILEKIIDNGDFTPPEPYDDLQLCKELALEYYAQGKSNGLEQEKLEMLRTFMSQVDILTKKAMPPPPQLGAPQAQPMPTPTSDLIQNTAGAA